MCVCILFSGPFLGAYYTYTERTSVYPHTRSNTGADPNPSLGTLATAHADDRSIESITS